MLVAKKEVSKIDVVNKKPLIRKNQTTGEMVAGFLDPETGVFEVAMEISDESTHTKLIGTVNNTHNDPDLQVSLPYAKGWTATSNGVQVDIEESMHRLAIPIPGGEFEVEVRYVTPYLKESLVLTIIGLCLFIGDISYNKLKERRGTGANKK